LGGPQVVFVLSIPEPLVLRAKILKQVQLELGNVIRAMPSSFRFNVIVTGRLESKEPVAAFSGLRDADREAKITAIEFCKQTFYSGHEEHPLGRTVESLLAEWPTSDQGYGEVCIVALTQNEQYADIAPEVFESLARMSSDRCSRFHVISTKPVPALGRLAAASGGTAMLVELHVGPSMDVEFKPWDVSAFNRAGSSPKPE
jgi:hypothetical protein